MIANNTAKDWLKKCKPLLFTDMSGDDESDDLSFEESIEDERTDLNPEMAMDEKEVRRLVLEILDQLPEDQRLVIGMFYYEEMSEIQAMLEARRIQEIQRNQCLNNQWRQQNHPHQRLSKQQGQPLEW